MTYMAQIRKDWKYLVSMSNYIFLLYDLHVTRMIFVKRSAVCPRSQKSPSVKKKSFISLDITLMTR